MPLMQNIRRIHRTILTTLLTFCATACAESASASEQNLTKIELPSGFVITKYADVPGARSMELGPDGTLYVGTRDQGSVYAVRDENGDHVGERVVTIARGLDQPNGVALRGGDLYVAEISRIIKYTNIAARLASPPQPQVVSTSFPNDEHHGWKFIKFGPDGKLYVPVGAPCNICEPSDDHAAIFRINPDGSGKQLYAKGIRNTVGFDWHPATGDLWFTDNGRDRMGNDVPPDELNRVTAAGQHFGYPYCHGNGIRDTEFGTNADCTDYVKPVQTLGPHVAALGMEFYRGTQFPASYRGQIFIAEHGSWNRDDPIGYRITTVKVSGNRPVYETFASGWLQGRDAWGRPVDVEEMPDGSLLVSDDKAGAIYRISYEPH